MVVWGDTMSLDNNQEFDSRFFELVSNSSNRTFFYYSNMKENWARWSKAAVEYFDLPGEYLCPAAEIWATRIHPDDVEMYNKDFENMANHVTPYHNCEYRIMNAEGEYVWVNCRGYVTYDDEGNMEWFGGFVTNMGQRNKIDAVTGLWTVFEFRSALQRMLEKEQTGGILLLGIENFKRVNAEYGYSFGDKTLYVIGQKLLALMESETTIYRMDGAEFAVIVPGGDEKALIELRNKIAHILDDLIVSNQQLHLRFQAAATVFPRDGMYIDQIQNNLFYAMEQAKLKKSQEIIFFSEKLYNERNYMARLKEAICTSVNNGCSGFRVVFQPLIAPNCGQCITAEALLRWSDDVFGNVSPVDFIPILEETNLIIPVGKWVIDQSLRYLSRWYDKDKSLKAVNVNVSYIQLQDNTLKDYVIQKLDEYGLPHDAIVIELTESCRVEQTAQLAGILQSFKDEGISIALDDFGTGYATLTVLKDIPADIVKIDHTMTRTIVDRPKDKSLIEFIVMYCKKAGIWVCAEGVETEVALDIVKNAGAELIQGYYYDKPLEARAFEEKYVR